MATATRYPILDAAVKSPSTSRYAADEVWNNDSHDCAEWAKDEEIWSTNLKRRLDLWKEWGGWSSRAPGSACLS